jgi:gluconolactonase
MKRQFRLAMRVCLLIALASATAKQRPQLFEWKGESAKFWELVPKDAQLEFVAGGMGFTEGPVWDPAGFVYVSDAVANKIFRIYPDGHTEEFISLGDPDGNTYDEHRQLIDCASVLRAVIRIKPDGTYTVLADRYQGKRFNGPNDVVSGPDGAFYFTDPTSDLPKGQKQELDFKGVFRLDAQGQVRLLTKDLTEPNGLAFSPDGKRLYVDDSEDRNIRVYDFQQDGTLRKGSILGEEPGGKGEGRSGWDETRPGRQPLRNGPGGIWVGDSGGNHLGTIIHPDRTAGKSRMARF